MKRFPFWLICIIALLIAPFIGGLGGSLLMRATKGPRTWKELPQPLGEKVVAILDATVSIKKENRLCVKTDRGAVYLWRGRLGWGGLDCDWSNPNKYWQAVSSPPDGQSIQSLIISQCDDEKLDALLACRTVSGRVYVWQKAAWQPFETAAILHDDWPKPLLAEATSKPQHVFRPWFTLPRLRGKVVDEVRTSFEGSLSWWVACYALLEDGRLLSLATETDFIDAVAMLGGAAAGLVTAIVLLVLTGIRRRCAQSKAIAAAPR